MIMDVPEKQKVFERFYRLGDKLNKVLKRPQTIDGTKIISIGNITTGGTGKTPAVIYFSKLLNNEEYKLGVLSRGYGGSAMKTGAILSDGKKILLSHKESGDEPFLIASNLQGVPVAIGKSRYNQGLALRDKCKCDLFLLDDGFQHYSLSRDVDIVLIDALNPFGNGHTLPHGILREPLEALKRSDILILTKTRLADQGSLAQLTEMVTELSGHSQIFLADHDPIGFVKLPCEYGNFQKPLKTKPLSTIQSETVWALSAIGSHRSFEKTLTNIGAKKVKSITYRDHYQYSKKDIQSLLRRVSPYDFIVTTEKDWVKLREFSDLLKSLKNFYFLKIQFVILNNEILLKEGLKAKILKGKK